MDLMVNPVITGFRQEVDGTIKELKLGEAKQDAYANIIEQGGADLENNKAATINVSNYTQPVEVTPTSGKDGMKKATITLSNIPSPSGTLAYPGYKKSDNEAITMNTNIDRTKKIFLVGSEMEITTFSMSYNSETDEVTITGGGMSAGTYERDTSLDLYLL